MSATANASHQYREFYRGHPEATPADAKRWFQKTFKRKPDNNTAYVAYTEVHGMTLTQRMAAQKDAPSTNGHAPAPVPTNGAADVKMADIILFCEKCGGIGQAKQVIDDLANLVKP